VNHEYMKIRPRFEISSKHFRLLDDHREFPIRLSLPPFRVAASAPAVTMVIRLASGPKSVWSSSRTTVFCLIVPRSCSAMRESCSSRKEN